MPFTTPPLPPCAARKGATVVDAPTPAIPKRDPDQGQQTGDLGEEQTGHVVHPRRLARA